MEKEREGKGEGRKRGRRRGGGEKMKGIVIGGMIIGLLLGCNNGIAELEKKSTFYESVANLGKGFLSIFTDLGDMVTEALGIKADTKKSDIGKYFTDIEKTMTSVKEKLQAEVTKNGNYEKVKTVVDKFITETLDKIAEGAKEAAKGAAGDDTVIGNAKQNEDAKPADATSVNAFVKGIKIIVGVVLGGKGNPDATKTGTTEQKSIGKLLSGKGASDGEEKHAAAVSASIGAVSGVDILQAIAKSAETAGKVDLDQAKDAASIAASQKGSAADFTNERKDAVLAAGIALRAMAKNGQLSAKTGEEKSAHAINGASVSAVNKTLSTLIIAIRTTVDSGLKKINEALVAVKQEDVSAETGEAGGATKK